MTAEIHHFSEKVSGNRPVIPGEPDAKCVEALEAWLEMAKRGEIVAVAMVGVDPTGSITTRFTTPGHPISAHLVTAASCLWFRIMSWFGEVPLPVDRE